MYNRTNNTRKEVAYKKKCLIVIETSEYKLYKQVKSFSSSVYEITVILPTVIIEEGKSI